MRKFSRLVGLLVLAAAVLSGCATSFVVETNVHAFSSLPALPAPATYRFERLPSQQAFPFQPQIEAMADPALSRAGLRRDDNAARLGVQVTARMQPTISPWANHWGGWGGYGYGFGYGRGAWGGRWGGGFGYADPFYLESPWYHREVGIVVRDLPTNRVVFETNAVSDGPWSDDAAVFPAMFDAALQGFPAPPPGPRQVNVKVGQ
jgi:hypothetical protein